MNIDDLNDISVLIEARKPGIYITRHNIRVTLQYIWFINYFVAWSIISNWFEQYVEF